MAAYNYYPNYYNTPSWRPMGQTSFVPYPQHGMAMAPAPNPQFMIQVDGEIGAKAWQPQMALGPNTVIPLWDYDGLHVYFKSTDAYGRMNPVRKAKVIFEDEPQNLPQGQSMNAEEQNNGVSGAGENPQLQMNPDQYVTRDDLNDLKNEIRQMLSTNHNVSGQQQGNQNSGNNQSAGNQNGRGNRV